MVYLFDIPLAKSLKPLDWSGKKRKRGKGGRYPFWDAVGWFDRLTTNLTNLGVRLNYR